MTGRSCCMIRMQCQILPLSSENGSTVHAQSLGFCYSVNHQEKSYETLEAQHCIILHDWKEGVNKYLPYVGWYSSSRYLMLL